MELPQIEVSFLLISDDDNIDMITDKLKIIPSKIRKKESFKISEFAHTLWELSSGRENCKVVSWQFDKVLSMLLDKENIINNIMEEYNLEACFVVSVHAENGDGPEVILTREIIKFAGKINARIDFDLYYY